MAPRIPVALAGVVLALACGMEEYRNADLQLDVAGADVTDEDRVRICVGEVGLREQAVGAGRLGFAGLPAGGQYSVVVDQLAVDGVSRLGRAGPVLLGEEVSWAEVAWEDCSEDCAACEAAGDRAVAGAADWLLAVHFLEGA